MRSVIGYCRQSAARPGETGDTSLSLESQEQRIRTWADDNGFPIGAIFRDHDLKGDDPNRPALRKAIDKLSAGDVLAVYDLSRLARDNVLQETIYRDINARGGVLVSVTEPHVGDDLFRGLMGVINQQFRKQLGLRISAARDAKAKRGEFAGRPPVGYLKESGRLVIDEQWAPVIRSIFLSVIANESFFSIAKRIHEEHPDFPINIDHKAIRNIINKWTYSGGVPARGEVIWCDDGPCHPPIVPKEIQERAIEAAERRSYSHIRRKPYVSPLSGKVIHECGRPAYHRYSATSTSKNSFACAGNSQTPRCTVKRTIIAESKLLDYVAELLRIDLSTIPNTADAAVAIAEENFNAMLPDAERKRRLLEGDRAALIKRKERAVQIRLDGLKDREWLVAETAKIDEGLTDIDAQLASIPDAINPALIRELSVAAIQHRDHINALSAQQSADLLGPLGVVQFGPSGVTIKYNEPYSFLFPKPAVLNWPGHKAK